MKKWSAGANVGCRSRNVTSSDARKSSGGRGAPVPLPRDNPPSPRPGRVKLWFSTSTRTRTCSASMCASTTLSAVTADSAPPVRGTTTLHTGQARSRRWFLSRSTPFLVVARTSTRTAMDETGWRDKRHMRWEGSSPSRRGVESSLTATPAPSGTPRASGQVMCGVLHSTRATTTSDPTRLSDADTSRRPTATPRATWSSARSRRNDSRTMPSSRRCRPLPCCRCRRSTRRVGA